MQLNILTTTIEVTKKKEKNHLRIVIKFAEPWK